MKKKKFLSDVSFRPVIDNAQWQMKQLTKHKKKGTKAVNGVVHLCTLFFPKMVHNSTLKVHICT